MSKQDLPEGYNQSRLASVAAFYEKQSDDEAAQDSNRSFDEKNATFVQIPAAFSDAIAATLARLMRELGEKPSPLPRKARVKS